MQIKPILSIAAALAVTGLAQQANAEIHEYSGSATVCTTTCNSFAALGGPGDSDNTVPSDLTGALSIDAGPNTAWTFADVDVDGISFEVFTAGAETEAAEFDMNGILLNPNTANPLPLNSDIAAVRETITTGVGQTFTTAGTTDADGELDSGTILFEFLVSPFSDNAAWVVIDLATGNTQVCILFTGLGCVPGGTETVAFAGNWSLVPAAADSDEDGVTDDTDNCTLVANANQRDTNGDNIGNVCDQDLSGNCSVSFEDLGQLKSVFFTPNDDADFDGNGVVSFEDLGAMKAAFFGPPGPSANGCN